MEVGDEGRVERGGEERGGEGGEGRGGGEGGRGGWRAGICLAFIYDGWVGNWARVGYVNHGSYNVSYARQNSIVYNQFTND